MTELNNFTKEQLVEMLRQKENSGESQTSHTGDVCHYKPVRSNQPPCSELSTTAWGFCKKHSRTVQARKAREQYEEDHVPKEPVVEQDFSQPPPVTINDELNAMEEKVLRNSRKTVVRQRVQEQKSRGKRRSPKRGIKKPVIKKKILRPNFWNRYEDTDSHILFDPTTKCAYGIQDPTGKVLGLTERHIRICEANGWNYNKPSDYSSDDSDDYSESEESYYSSEDEYSD